MNIRPTGLSGAKLIEPTVYGDHRGFFMESYQEKLWNERGLVYRFVQDNHSLSREAGVLRGLHYQLNPLAQTKLVRVTKGAVYDVIVDIRRGSPSYGKWEGFILSADNHRQLLVPRGFAHGFCTLVPDCEVQYKVDQYYSQAHDRGIAWNDPALAIDWPTNTPVLSDKDGRHPLLADADNNFEYEG